MRSPAIPLIVMTLPRYECSDALETLLHNLDKSWTSIPEFQSALALGGHKYYDLYSADHISETSYTRKVALWFLVYGSDSQLLGLGSIIDGFRRMSIIAKN